MISAAEYTALPREFGSATSALIIRAKKFVKKMTMHPYGQEPYRHSGAHVVGAGGSTQERVGGKWGGG